MKIYLASDHAGYELKEALTPFLQERGFEVEDVGPVVFDPEDDYPDYILPLAAKVADDKGSFGIAMGGNGQGEAIVANRVKGVRAAVYYGPAAHSQIDITGQALDMLASTRVHDNTNILCLAARFMSIEEAKGAVLLWLQTPFSGEERHVRRIKKIDAKN
jgi:ribose 5-phosphate isomerase B